MNPEMKLLVTGTYGSWRVDIEPKYVADLIKSYIEQYETIRNVDKKSNSGSGGGPQ